MSTSYQEQLSNQSYRYVFLWMMIKALTASNKVIFSSVNTNYTLFIWQGKSTFWNEHVLDLFYVICII